MRALRILLTLLAILIANTLFAQQGGVPDSLFGANGVLMTHVSNWNDKAHDAVQQPDGKIVAVGETGTNYSYGFALTRYNIDGTLDSTFGTGGIVIDYVSYSMSRAKSVAIQPDGKIVVAGSNHWVSGSTTASSILLLLRYKVDGTRDSTFGFNGAVQTNIDGSVNENAFGMKLDTNGKIYMAAFTTYSTVLVRYNQNGFIDSTFATNGIANAGSTSDVLRGAFTMQPDGKFLLAWGVTNSGPPVIYLKRLNQDGTFDNTFGTNGSVEIQHGNDPAIALQTDGKIVLTGDTYISRFNPDGTFDNSFGGAGEVTAGFGLTAVKVQADGKIIVGGGGWSSFGIGCFNPDGSPDSTFGINGRVTIPFPANWAECNNLILQNDYRILAVGASAQPLNTNNYRDFTLVRVSSTIPSMRLNTVSVNINCSTNTGGATVQVSGGIPPYQYNWSNGQTNSSASMMPAGIYMVTVTDSMGSTAHAPVTINRRRCVGPAIIYGPIRLPSGH